MVLPLATWYLHDLGVLYSSTAQSTTFHFSNRTSNACMAICCRRFENLLVPFIVPMDLFIMVILQHQSKKTACHRRDSVPVGQDANSERNKELHSRLQLTRPPMSILRVHLGLSTAGLSTTTNATGGGIDRHGLSVTCVGTVRETCRLCV